MKILYSWLKDFIDVDLSADELASKLVSLGIEVAEITKTGVDFEGVYTAKVLKVERHPNADKLNLVTVETGKGQKTIVCGAPNVVEGITVPLAHDGARLGKNILKASEIRGVKSDGMICSSDELGLTNTRQKGILHLDGSLEAGVDVSTLYPKADYVFDLELTANRADLLSHLGIARELSILLDIPLKKPELKPVKESDRKMEVKVCATDACNRYCGRIVSGVQNTESPEWMKTRLAAMGVNPKNALVDISNYILYHIGQPLHFFNLKEIDGGVINVRMALEGEEFTTLDGNKINLSASDLLIADAKKGVCLAGVMGGLNSGIEDDTKDIFIEAAYFNPPTINKTAKKYGYSSESSQRFERGTDISITTTALELATNLVQELCGGTAGVAADEYPVPYEPADVIFTKDEITAILGVEFEEEKLKKVFGALGASFGTELKEWIFVSPQHRRDLNHKWDLAEEAARFVGIDNIPWQIHAQEFPLQIIPEILTWAQSLPLL
ncbi:phenylalanyl-tRNA synthetase beta subunit [Elusimicrobium posterum]|uniref:phenylalanine--tRNA ligase subunit beta n=1 Tax=Elusimicrobium posterum TaxID=3116653 RepID=UPI003C71A596